MFNIGPLELMVLAIVALIVLGPDRLPQLARDAAQLLRTLRDLATGARQQLRDELGPEFADVDLRNLNPRTAVRNAVFGEDFDFEKLNPRTAFRDAVRGDEDLRAADPRGVLRETRDAAMGYDPDPTYTDPTFVPVDDAARYDAGFTARRNGHAPSEPIDMSKPRTAGSGERTAGSGERAAGPVKPVSAPPANRPRPRPRPSSAATPRAETPEPTKPTTPGPATPWDDNAT